MIHNHEVPSSILGVGTSFFKDSPIDLIVRRCSAQDIDGTPQSLGSSGMGPASAGHSNDGGLVGPSAGLLPRRFKCCGAHCGQPA